MLGMLRMRSRKVGGGRWAGGMPMTCVESQVAGTRSSLCVHEDVVKQLLFAHTVPGHPGRLHPTWHG